VFVKSNILAVLLCSILAVAGCAVANSPSAPVRATSTPRVVEPAYTVERGKVVKTTDFSGRISPIEEIPLYFRASGYVQEVHVKQGEWVHAGDLLAKLEASDLLNQIAQAEVNLDSAQRLLSKAEESLEQEIDLADLDLSIAKAKLSQAKDTNVHAIKQAELALQSAQEDQGRTLALQATINEKIVSARVTLAQATDEVERAQIEYQKALERPWEPQQVKDALAREHQRADWARENAQAQYDSAIAGQEVHRHDLKMQEIGIQQAETTLDQLKAGVDPLLSLEVQRAQLLLDQLQGGVDPSLISAVNQAELTLEGLRQHLDDAQIVATANGQILSLSLYPGRPVEAFRTVLVIADPTTLEVAANPTADQLQSMVEGQQAVIVPGTAPDRTWTGIIRCLPYPYGTCGTADDPSGSDKLVRIRLENASSDLQIGALVQVTIVLDEKENALWLPPDAIRTFQSRSFVVVQTGASQRQVNIETGIEGQDRVEILGGLEQGQVVVAP
jgi:multidrug efflux pump subunit AcrA (membrane-fusion protein)